MNKAWLLTNEQYDNINPPSRRLVAGDDGKIYEEFINDERWLHMGYVPMPKNRLAWFFHHVMHGLMMGYPLLKVILFALDKDNDGGTTVEVSDVS